MSELAPLPQGIYDRLIADATLVGPIVGGVHTGHLQGGVWDIPLKRDGPRKTDTAFYDNDKGRMVRPSAVVLDDGDDPHAQEASVPTAYEGTVEVQLFGPPTSTGKAALHAATARIIGLVYGYRWTIAPGITGNVEGIPTRQGVIDSETIIGAKEDRLIITVRSRYRDEV